MVTWSVRWRTPQERTTTARVLRMPVEERPAVILPVQSTVEEAHTKVRHLSEIFPEIIIAIGAGADDRTYARDMMQYVRRGFRTGENGQSVQTRFGVTPGNAWTPEQACQILSLVRLTVAGRGCVERPFPDHLVEHVIAQKALANDEWKATAQSYLRNGLRVYARFPNTPGSDLGSTIDRFFTIANGLLLEPGTVLGPTAAYDLEYRCTGVVEERHGHK